MLKLNHLFVNSLYLVVFLYFTSYGNHYKCSAKKIRYISTEHPRVTYVNPKYFSFANLTSQRYGRKNPVYYVGLHFESLVTIDYNISADFYFYEYLSNMYKPSFVEMHFEICHMLLHDKFFGAPMLRSFSGKPCPYPPGVFHLYNMSIPLSVIPQNFPFRKGRIYANASSTDTKEYCAGGYIDMEIKEINIK